MKKKTIALLMAMMVALGCAVGGTVAWLVAQTTAVTNTFTVGDINITLTEEKSDFKMVPGRTIAKDPKVTVKANSEACWLFVKVEESSNLKDFITYEVAEGWTALEGNPGVYYREVAAATADTEFAVLQNNRVTVKGSVTKAMLEGVKAEGAAPTLTFTAYAVQKDGIDTVADAWAKANAQQSTEQA